MNFKNFDINYIERLNENNSSLFNIFSPLDIFIKNKRWERVVFNGLQNFILYRNIKDFNFIRKIVKVSKEDKKILKSFKRGERQAVFIGKDKSYLFCNIRKPEIYKIYCTDKIHLLNYPIYMNLLEEKIADKELNKLIESYFLLNELK